MAAFFITCRQSTLLTELAGIETITSLPNSPIKLKVGNFHCNKPSPFNHHHQEGSIDDFR